MQVRWVTDNIHCTQNFYRYAVDGHFQGSSVEGEGQKKPDTCGLKIELGGEELEGMKGNRFLFVWSVKEFHGTQCKRESNRS